MAGNFGRQVGLPWGALGSEPTVCEVAALTARLSHMSLYGAL